MITPPISRKAVVTGDPRGKKMQGAARHTNNLSMRERLLKGFFFFFVYELQFIVVAAWHCISTDFSHIFSLL